MKHLIILLIIIFGFTSCLTFYEEETSPKVYMGGGKFVFTDYKIIVISSISEVEYIKSDTICLSGFASEYGDGETMKLTQNYVNTPKDRRFIIGQTKWEFDGSYLYCDFANTNGTISPTHEGYWVNYPKYLTTDYSKIEITNADNGSKTVFTFETNNYGVAPPSKLTLLSSEIITDLYTSQGARDKAITVRILLTFMR